MKTKPDHSYKNGFISSLDLDSIEVLLTYQGVPRIEMSLVMKIEKISFRDEMRRTKIEVYRMIRCNERVINFLI